MKDRSTERIKSIRTGTGKILSFGLAECHGNRTQCHILDKLKTSFVFALYVKEKARTDFFLRLSLTFLIVAMKIKKMKLNTVGSEGNRN